MKTVIRKFEDDVELNFIMDDTHEFLLSSKEVALGYGVNTETIRQTKARNKDELYEGKHFMSGSYFSRDKMSQLNVTANNVDKQTFWTKRGLVRLGFFIKSQRAKKFRDWCEDLIIEEMQTPHKTQSKELDINDDIMRFYDIYGILNPSAEFYIQHQGLKAKAFVDKSFGFIISTPELARIMGVKESTLRVLKKYHGDRLKEDKHFVKFGYSTWWTREGAGWIALHNRDGSFGQYLLSGELNKKLDIEAQYLDLESLALLERVIELSAQERIS